MRGISLSIKNWHISIYIDFWPNDKMFEISKLKWISYTERNNSAKDIKIHLIPEILACYPTGKDTYNKKSIYIGWLLLNFYLHK